MKLFNHLTPILLFVSFTAAGQTLNQAIEAYQRHDIKQAISLFKQHKQQLTAKIYLARLYMSDDLDEAEDWIEKAVEQAPESAEAHFVRGRVMGMQASNAFLSAMSYAKKSLHSFAQAAKLEADNIQYQTGLMQFHLNAPSIAGGDMDIAKQQAEKITKLDKVAGQLAHIRLALANDDKQQAQTLIAEGKQAYPNRAELHYYTGMQAQQAEDYSQAFTDFAQAINASSQAEASTLARFNALYQTGRTAVLSENNLEQGKQALNEYLDTAPKHQDLPESYWATFRLGNLYQLAGDKAKARQLYQQLQNVKDKALQKRIKKRLRKLNKR